MKPRRKTLTKDGRPQRASESGLRTRRVTSRDRNTMKQALSHLESGTDRADALHCAGYGDFDCMQVS